MDLKSRLQYFAGIDNDTKALETFELNHGKGQNEFVEI